MYKFGIPSYHRPACKTIDVLLSIGVSKEDIFVSLQDKNELENYRKIHPDVHFLVREADCAAGNRNTLISYLETPFIVLDDDVTAFVVKDGKMMPFRKIDTLVELEHLIEKDIKTAIDNDVSIIGCAATSNDLIARNRTLYNADTLLQGSFLIFIKKIYFDEKWKMVEDYELSLRAMRNSHTLRNNYLSIRKPQNGSNKGGLHERYANNELPGWIATLHKKYPEFKPNKAMTGGCVRFGK